MASSWINWRFVLALWMLLLVTGQSFAKEAAKQPTLRSADPATYLSDIVGELKKVWPNNRMVVIVCHGHSVPTGYFTGGKVRPFDSYPHLTHVAIQNRYQKSVVEVIRTGIGGENSEQGAKRFAADVLAKKPDVITIDYSLNDRSLGLKRARIAWESMIQQAKEAGVKVILMTPTADTRARLNDPTEILTHHAQQVRELASKHQVGLADSYAAFQKYLAEEKDLKALMSQANHPNRKGHEMVALELAKWFQIPQ